MDIIFMVDSSTQATSYLGEPDNFRNALSLVEQVSCILITSYLQFINPDKVFWGL